MTLPIPDKARMLEDEAELWRYREVVLEPGSRPPMPSKLVLLPYTPALLSRPPTMAPELLGAGAGLV